MKDRLETKEIERYTSIYTEIEDVCPGRGGPGGEGPMHSVDSSACACYSCESGVRLKGYGCPFQGPLPGRGGPGVEGRLI